MLSRKDSRHSTSESSTFGKDYEIIGEYDRYYHEYQKFTVNAKGRELYDKKSFKDLVGTKRCVILIEGFYESMHVGEGKTAVKYPFYITPKENEFSLQAGSGTSGKILQQSSLH